jgi:NAD+ synthase (glutamine-hydrolysing)
LEKIAELDNGLKLGRSVKIAIAQKNFIVGDITGNTEIIKNLVVSEKCRFVDIVVFPELSLCGYPPEDLLLKPEFYRKVQLSLQALQQTSQDVEVAFIVGYPVSEQEQSYNAVSLLHRGEILATHFKQALPNYSVFDEQRYFTAGNSSTVLKFKGKKIALQICEDLWQTQPMDLLVKKKPDVLIVANASPFHLGQYSKREALLKTRSQQLGCPIIYANLVGGQDELVFDGASMVYDSKGNKIAKFPQFEECFGVVEIAQKQIIVDTWLRPNPTNRANYLTELYQALVLGVRDYVTKNGFKGAVIGLSGGIDSALTLAVAVDALGAANVTAIMMPFRFTSSMSLEDAQRQANTMGVQYEVISIEPIYEQFIQQLKPLFKNKPADTTEENLQARCRGVLLMAYSNKFGNLVLTTGNKSEMAVGYATLYGDMAGGFAVLKDVFKISVYELAKYRNESGEVIPQRVITRAPSAELAPDQIDQDSLPPYAILDSILKAYIEHEEGLKEIVEHYKDAPGFDLETVRRVINLVDINEHKRRQAPPGVRVSSRAFGRDHRYPITSAYRKQP